MRAGPSPPPEPSASVPAWQRVDWRAHLRWVEAGGARVNVVDLRPPPPRAGELPIVLVHGLAGSWQDWLETIPALAGSRRVVAFDLPGFGHSPLPDWSLSIEAYAGFVERLLAELGISRCALVGHSMGGLIAAQAAVDHPDLCSRLALLAPAGISSTSTRPLAAAAVAHALDLAAPAIARLGPRALRRRRLRAALFAANFHDAGRISPELLYETLVNSAEPPGFVEALTALIGHDIRERIAEIEAPALVAWGREDRIVPASDAIELSRLLDGARIELLERTGHLLQLERPAQVNLLLEDLLVRR